MKLLRPYQKEALHSIYNENKIALFFDMRLGKTLIIIRRLRKVIGSFLVVAPNDALISWEKELAEENESFIKLTGTRNERLEKLDKAFSSVNEIRFVLTNKESHLSIPELQNFNWTALILDESTFIKNPKAKVTKYYLSYRFWSVPIKAILSGTPNPESNLDYICQLKFLNLIPVKDYWTFRAMYCKPERFDWKIGNEGNKLLKSSLDKCHILKRKDVSLDIPKVYEKRSIELPKKLRKVYNEILKNWMLEFEDLKLDTKYAPVAFLWLRQLASGVIQNRLIWDGKIKLIHNLLTGELKNEPTLIWTNFVSEHEAVRKALKCPSISGATPPQERLQLVSSFQKGNISLLVIQVPTAKFGLNLSRATTAIYYSSPVSYLERSQSEDRILNVDDKRPLLYIDLLTENTMDKEIIETIKDKKLSANLKIRLLKEVEVVHNRK